MQPRYNLKLPADYDHYNKIDIQHPDGETKKLSEVDFEYTVPWLFQMLGEGIQNLANWRAITPPAKSLLNGGLVEKVKTAYNNKDSIIKSFNNLEVTPENKDHVIRLIILVKSIYNNCEAWDKAKPLGYIAKKLIGYSSRAEALSEFKKGITRLEVEVEKLQQQELEKNVEQKSEAVSSPPVQEEVSQQVDSSMQPAEQEVSSLATTKKDSRHSDVVSSRHIASRLVFANQVEVKEIPNEHASELRTLTTKPIKEPGEDIELSVSHEQYYDAREYVEPNPLDNEEEIFEDAREYEFEHELELFSSQEPVMVEDSLLEDDRRVLEALKHFIYDAIGELEHYIKQNPTPDKIKSANDLKGFLSIKSNTIAQPNYDINNVLKDFTEVGSKIIGERYKFSPSAKESFFKKTAHTVKDAVRGEGRYRTLLKSFEANLVNIDLPNVIASHAQVGRRNFQVR